MTKIFVRMRNKRIQAVTMIFRKNERKRIKTVTMTFAYGLLLSALESTSVKNSRRRVKASDVHVCILATVVSFDTCACEGSRE